MYFTGENMKKLFIAVMMVLVTVTAGLSEAEARRLGGGGSFGRQSQNVTRQAPARQSQSPDAARPAVPPAAVPPQLPKPSSPWKGILGGALLGLGLGALFSHLGIGAGMASLLGTLLTFGLIALVIGFIYRMVMRRKSGNDYLRPAFAGDSSAAYPGSADARVEPSHTPPLPVAGAAPVNYSPWGVPVDFDTPGFLRHAKTYFIRLQAAWDKADINDIREFTTPEMYAEIKLQIQERGASPNVTDVVSLDAELLGMEQDATDHIASVRFSGTMKEAPGAAAEPFEEVWNLSKPLSGTGGWVLAGIQQLSKQ
jgi:predicted lipid-binding transport protein (Tim44 family)